MNLVALTCSASNSQAGPTAHDGIGKTSASERELLVLGTMDGKLSALDLSKKGTVAWQRSTGDRLLSSSVSDIEFVHNGVPTRLIPSLDSSLFRFERGGVVRSTPFTAEKLLSASVKLSPDLTVVGSLEKVVHALNPATGEILYQCDKSGCPGAKEIEAKTKGLTHVLLARHNTQAVRVISVLNGKERWNFSVGQHELDLVDIRESSGAVIEPLLTFRDREDIDELYSSIGSHANPEVSLRFSVSSGGVYYSRRPLGWPAHSEPPIKWKKELPAPIAKAWLLKNNVLEEIDLFDNDHLIHERMSDFSDTDQVEPSPLLYVGVFDKQMYVRQSPLFHHSMMSDHGEQSEWDSHEPISDQEVTWPRFRFQPLMATAPSRTPTINYNSLHELVTDTKMTESTALEYPYDNGYYLYADRPPASLLLPGNKPGKEGIRSVTVTTTDGRGLLTQESDSSSGVDPESSTIEYRIIYEGFSHYWKEMLFSNVMALVVGLLISYCWRRKKHVLKKLLPWYREPEEEEVADGDADRANESEENNSDQASPAGSSEGRSRRGSEPAHLSESREDSSGSGEKSAPNSEPCCPRDDAKVEPTSPPPVVEFKSHFLTNFTPIRVLGKGGFGVVYESRNKMDECLYAVKRIALPTRSERRDRALREVKALAKLDHPYIVRYFQTWYESPPAGWQENMDKELKLSVSPISMETSETPSSLPTKPMTKSFAKPNPLLATVLENPLQNNLMAFNNVTADVKTGGQFVSWGDSSDIRFAEPSQSGASADRRAEPGRCRFFQASNDEETTDDETADEDTAGKGNGSFEQSTGSIDFAASGDGADSGVQTTEQQSDSLGLLSSSTGESSVQQPFQRYSRLTDLAAGDEPDSSSVQFAVESGDVAGDDVSSPSRRADRHSETEAAAKRLEGADTEVAAVAKTTTPVAREYIYVQMQLCRKDTLHDFLRSASPSAVDRSTALRIMKELLMAVSYIHQQGMIHRDLKPSNIFFSLENTIKVGDFGLVKESQTGGEEQPAPAGGDGRSLAIRRDNSDISFQHGSRSGHTHQVGTQLYMSPEQVAGKKYSNKVDIFALGLVFVELLVPFETQMERVTTLTDAKNGKFPEVLMAQELEFKLVRWMLTVEHEDRPDIGQLETSEVCKHILPQSSSP